MKLRKHSVARDVLCTGPTLACQVVIENVPLVVGSLVIVADGETVVDHGDGRLIGQTSRGRIDYKTGQVHLYFARTVQGDVVAAYDVLLGETP